MDAGLQKPSERPGEEQPPNPIARAAEVVFDGAPVRLIANCGLPRTASPVVLIVGRHELHGFEEQAFVRKDSGFGKRAIPVYSSDSEFVQHERWVKVQTPVDGTVTVPQMICLPSVA